MGAAKAGDSCRVFVSRDFGRVGGIGSVSAGHRSVHLRERRRVGSPFPLPAWVFVFFLLAVEKTLLYGQK